MTITSFSGEYRFLSNFWYVYPHTIELKPYGLDRSFFYTTVEHAYQAAKSTELADRRAIQRIAKPGEVEVYGNTIQLREDWESIKLTIMLDLIRQKFKTPTLKRLLLQTGDQELIEGNHWHDCYWGVCSCNKCAARYYGENSPKNWLGRILMQVREE